MFYVRVTPSGNTYPYTLTDLIRANPNVSFGAVVSDESAAEFGVFPVAPTEPPPREPGKKLVRSAQQQGAGWVEVWTLVDMTPAEIEEERLASLPSSITPRQARLALLGAGLLETVEGAFAQLPEPQRTAAAIEWEYATSVERNSPLVAQFGPMLGLTEQQIDALFIAGSAL